MPPVPNIRLYSEFLNTAPVRTHPNTVTPTFPANNYQQFFNIYADSHVQSRQPTNPQQRTNNDVLNYIAHSNPSQPQKPPQNPYPINIGFNNFSVQPQVNPTKPTYQPTNTYGNNTTNFSNPGSFNKTSNTNTFILNQEASSSIPKYNPITLNPGTKANTTTNKN